MPGAKGKSGGARAGSGPAPFATIIGGPGAIYLRELTRRRLDRRDVTREECAETLRGILAHFAVHHHDEPHLIDEGLTAQQ